MKTQSLDSRKVNKAVGRNTIKTPLRREPEKKAVVNAVETKTNASYFIQNLNVTTDSHVKLMMAEDNSVNIPKTFTVSSNEFNYFDGDTPLNGKYPTGSNEFTAKLNIGPAENVLYATVNIFSRNNIFSDVHVGSYNEMYNGLPYNAIASAFGTSEITTHSRSFVGTKVSSFVAYEGKTPKRIMATGLEVVPTFISTPSVSDRALYWGNPNTAKPATLTNAKEYDDALNIGPITVSGKNILVGNYFSADSAVDNDFGIVAVDLVNSHKFGYYKMDTKAVIGNSIQFSNSGKVYYKNKPIASVWKLENPTKNKTVVNVHNTKTVLNIELDAKEWGYILSPELNFSHKIEILNTNQVQTITRPVNNNSFECKLKYRANAVNSSSLVLNDVDYPSDAFLKNAEIVKADGIATLVLTFEKGVGTTAGGDISPNTVFKIDINH